jgi:hypothetical protein
MSILNVVILSGKNAGKAPAWPAGSPLHVRPPQAHAETLVRESMDS